MKDQYMVMRNVVDRLVAEYQEHGGLQIAYDFDNTVYDYHKKGHSYEKVIELIRTLSKVSGIELTVWTGTAVERYEFVAKYLTDNNIPFTRINQNPPFFKSSSPKIFYSILLDDRAGLDSAYDTCIKFLERLDEMKPLRIFEEYIELYEKFLSDPRYTPGSIAHNPRYTPGSIAHSMYTKRLEEVRKIHQLLTDNAMTPEEFAKLNSRDKWDVSKMLKGKVIWFCESCGAYHGAEPTHAGFGEVYCNDCDYLLTHRTSGGQSNPMNYTFKYN